MNKENLIKARELILEALENAEITEIDKYELMINLSLLLNENTYGQDIAYLRLKPKNRRRE